MTKSQTSIADVMIDWLVVCVRPFDDFAVVIVVDVDVVVFLDDGSDSLNVEDTTVVVNVTIAERIVSNILPLF